MRAINGLKERPEFYNTLTTNCTNVILVNTRVNPDHLPFSWKILLSVYDAGRLDWSLSFEDIRIIAEALGHESLESTKIYTQVSFQRTRRIAELFGSPGEVK